MTPPRFRISRSGISAAPSGRCYRSFPEALMALSDIVGKVTGKDSGEDSEDFTETDGEFTGNADGPDPKAKRPESREKPKTAAPAARVPPHVRKEIAEKLGAMAEFFCMGLSLRDEYCGDALDAQREEIVTRAVAIICKRPRMVRWFTEGADYQDWLMLATALQPVAVAVWSHHVTRDRGHDDDQDVTRYAAPPLS
jgi:hypothetical protein